MTSISRVATVCAPTKGYGVMVAGVMRHLRSKLPQQTDEGCWVVVLSFVHLFISHVWRRYPKGIALWRFHRSLVTLAETLFEYTEDQQFQNVAKHWASLSANRIFRDTTPFPEKGYKPIFTGTLLRLIRTATTFGDLSLGQSLVLAKKGWDPLGQSRKSTALDNYEAAISKPRSQVVETETARSITFILTNLLSDVEYEKDVATFSPTMSAGYLTPVKNGGNLGALSQSATACNVPFGGLRGEVAVQELRRQELYDVASSAAVLGSADRRDFYRNAGVANEEWIEEVDQAFYAKVVAITEPSKFRLLACGDTGLYSALRPIQQMFLRAWKRSPFSTMKDDEGILGDMFKEWKCRMASNPRLFALSGDYEAATDNVDAAVSLFVHELACELTSVPERLVVAGRQALVDQIYVFPQKDLMFLGPLTLKDAEEYELMQATFLKQAAQCLTPLGRTRVAYQTLKDELALKRSSLIAEKDSRGKPLVRGPLKYVKQTTSQPMGCPLSFFLLCVINLSTLLPAFLTESPSMKKIYDEWDGDWATLRAYRSDKKSDLGKLCHWFSTEVPRRLKINGDDLGALLTPEGIRKWREVIGKTGLKESMGKSYVSRRMVMVNNRLWSFERDEFVGYLNFNLLYGTSAKKQLSYGTDNQIGRAISQMCKETGLRHLIGPILQRNAPGAIPKSFRHFKAGKDGEEKSFYHDFCLLPGAQVYFPTWLGGLGVDPALAPADWKITNLQRRYAAAALMHPELSLSTDGWKRPAGSLTEKYLPSLLQIQPNHWTSELSETELVERMERYKSFQATLAGLDYLSFGMPDWRQRTKETRKAWIKAARCQPMSELKIMRYMDKRPVYAAPFVVELPTQRTVTWRNGSAVGTVRRWRDGGQLVRLCLNLAVTDQ